MARRRYVYEVGGRVTLDPSLTDAEKVEALVQMLTKERARYRRARIRWAQTLTRIATEWQSLFDECVEVTDLSHEPLRPTGRGSTSHEESMC